MSLVGTRPILQDELQKYELHHRARIAIKPGITGMWQVSGRSDITDFEEVVRNDYSTYIIRKRQMQVMKYSHICLFLCKDLFIGMSQTAFYKGSSFYHLFFFFIRAVRG